MKIEPGKTYRFTKSGRLVRTVVPSEPYCGQATWTVERVDDAGVGKRMTVPARALLPHGA